MVLRRIYKLGYEYVSVHIRKEKIKMRNEKVSEEDANCKNTLKWYKFAKNAGIER